MPRSVITLIVLLIFAEVWTASAKADDNGRFEGRVVAVWDDTDGRSMTLTEDFAYIDPNGRRWLAPSGRRIDGASIPQVFWSVTGGPFEGKYRFASVVHDVACEDKTAPWQDVHRMFYSASLLGGVGVVEAKTMYAAVYHFGPRWPPPGVVAVLLPRALTTEDDFLRMQEFIRTHPNLSLSQIDGTTRRELQRAVPVVPRRGTVRPTQ